MDFKGNLGNIMKQAQEMQKQLKQAQNELANIYVTGESGAGLAKIDMSCRYDVRNVQIDPSLLTEKKSVIEDLIAAAINDAIRKVETSTNKKMKGIASSMHLPDELLGPDES